MGRPRHQGITNLAKRQMSQRNFWVALEWLTLAAFIGILLAATGSAEGQIVLPITENDGLLRVTIRLNNTPRVLLLDTGALISLVSPEASGLSPVEISRLRKIKLYGAGGSGTEVRVAAIMLTLGERKVTGEVIVGEMSNLRLPDKCDGILGNDVLSQFKKVVIDYMAHTLTLE
jgi:hypothetical protein